MKSGRPPFEWEQQPFLHGGGMTGNMASTASSTPFTGTNLPPYEQISPTGWVSSSHSPASGDSSSMASSVQPRGMADRPMLVHNADKPGQMFAKLTVPSEASTPYPAQKQPCADLAAIHECSMWKERYSCGGCCIGGLGDRTAKPMTVGEVCPSVCNSTCAKTKFSDLRPATLQSLGFDDFVDESHYPNPDA